MTARRPATGRATTGRQRQSLPALAVLLAVAAMALFPALAAVQATARAAADPWRPTRVAKWTLLAIAAGVGGYAYQQSARGDARYAELRRRCERDASACRPVGGRYDDPEAARLFRAANAHDRRAQVAIGAGQLTLVGSAAFFILDLRHRESPENIPYDPARRGARAALRAGFRLPL